MDTEKQSNDQEPIIGSCPTIVVDDDPSEVDIFHVDTELGPHERISQTIAKMIGSSRELDGKVIGLEGGWGTGKTTIVRILNKELEKTSDIKLFSFDAWAHEGDPLRRTFLESLINYFQNEKWVDEKRWDHELAIIAKRTKRTITITSQDTTLFGRALALSAIFVPLGIPFLVHGLSSGVTLAASNSINFSFILGLIFTSAPVVVIVVRAIALLFESEVTTSEPEEVSPDAEYERSVDDEIEKLQAVKTPSKWAFITGNEASLTTQNTSSSPEPTSIEFERKFKELLGEALSGGEGRKFVLVLDNLDRINSEDALRIWSTLQTFLQHIPGSHQTDLKQISIIVPFDRKGISKHFGSGEQSDLVMSSFIEKSFHIRFLVPPLIQSDWKDYFVLQLEEAFPERHTKDEFREMYKLLKVCFDQAEPAISPTPRQLISYVNQVGIYHRQWVHRYPLVDVLYFIFCKERNIPIERQLIDGDLPERMVTTILSDNVKKNIAGLFYNVSPEKGFQILLSKPINEALLKNSSVDLSNLFENNQDGFLMALGTELENLKECTPSQLANISKTLDESNIFQEIADYESASFMNTLNSAIENVESWEPLDEEISEGIVSLVAVLGQDSAERIYKKLARAVLSSKNENSEESGFLSKTIEERIDKVVYILEGLKNRAIRFHPTFQLTLPGSEANWIELCVHISTKPDIYHGIFKPKFRISQLENELIEGVSSGLLAKDALSKAILITNLSVEGCKWTRLLSSVKERMHPNNSIELNELHTLLDGIAIVSLNNEAGANILLDELSTNGILLHYFDAAHSASNYQLIGQLAFIILKYNPSISIEPHIGQSQSGQSNLESLLETADQEATDSLVLWLNKTEASSWLFKVVDARAKFDSLIVDCFQCLIKTKPVEELLPKTELLARWKELSKAFSSSEYKFDDLLEAYDSVELLIQALMTPAYEFAYEDAGLYLKLKEKGSTEQFNKALMACLLTLNDKQWLSEFEDEGDMLEIAFLLSDEGLNIDLGHNYCDGVENYAGRLIADPKIYSPWVFSHKDDMFPLISEERRKILAIKVLDLAIHHQPKLNESFFSIFGFHISSFEVLESRPNVVTLLFDNIVKMLELSQLTWLLGVIRKDPKQFKLIGKKAEQTILNERIVTTLSSEIGDDVSKIMLAMSEALELELPHKAKEESEESEGKED